MGIARNIPIDSATVPIVPRESKGGPDPYISVPVPKNLCPDVASRKSVCSREVSEVEDGEELVLSLAGLQQQEEKEEHPDTPVTSSGITVTMREKNQAWRVGVSGLWILISEFRTVDGLSVHHQHPWAGCISGSTVSRQQQARIGKSGTRIN